jgi:TRAP-type transport system periplasmic protein
MRHGLTRRTFLQSLGVAGGGAMLASIGGRSATAAAPQMVFKFSHGEAPDSAQGKTADAFAEAVGKRSGGRIKVDVFHAGQLAGGGDVRVELERVQLGVIDITSSAGTLYFAAFDPRFNVVQLPYLFKDDTAYLKYIRSAPSAQEMLKAVEKNGFKALTFWPRPFRQLTNSKRLVRTPADMKGVKVRVPPVEMLTDSFTAFGASPVAMAWSEVYTALQNGTIDGQDNAVEVMWSAKLYEVQKYLSLIEYTRDAFMPSMNKAKYDALAPDLQKALLDAAVEAAEFRLSYDRTSEQRFQTMLKEKGVEIAVLSASDKQAFRHSAAPVWEKWSKKLGKEFFDRVVKEVEG